MARPTLVIAAVDDDMLRCWHSQLAPNFNQFDEFIFVFYSIFFLFSRSARCNTTRDPSQNTIEVWLYMNVIAVLWHNDVRWDIDAAWSWLSTEMTANGRSSPRYMFRCCSQPFELIKYWRKKNASYFVAFVNFFSLYLFFVTFFNHIYIYLIWIKYFNHLFTFIFFSEITHRFFLWNALHGHHLTVAIVNNIIISKIWYM